MKIFGVEINLGGKPATSPRARLSNRAEPVNASSNATASTVQAAIRSAEAGDTRQLFALYRDVILGDTHAQGEFNKRKLAVLAQPAAILPADKNKPEDVKAAAAVLQMMRDCENWTDGLSFLLDSTLWPLSSVEKIFGPPAEDSAVKLNYTLRQLVPVNPALYCFKRPGIEDKIELGAWEPNVRFYSTDENGSLLWDYSKTYAADPIRHIIHRGHLLVGIRDNWGGPMRAILGWWLLGVLARDWFGRFMERFGNPFIVGRTDSTNKEAVQFLEEALSLATKIGGLVVDHETAIELKEAMLSGGAEAYDKFLSICNREKSKLIVGHDLSASAAPTGLGSGVADLQNTVREDIRMFDQIRLGETLQKQLFAPFLKINGLRGAAPKIVWGGLSDADAKTFAELLNVLSQAGFEPEDDAISTVNERLGFSVRRKAAMPAPGFGGGFAPGAFSVFSAGIPRMTHPSDSVAEQKAAALAASWKIAYGPMLDAIRVSSSKEDLEKRLREIAPHLVKSERTKITEEVLQIAAAKGVADK